MNKIKEAVIKADPRMKGLVVVMIAYIGIMFAVFNVGATDQIDNYVETIDVTVEDGNTGQKGYLVRQNSVSDVLDELGIVVNPQDIVNLDLNYVVNDGDLIQITRVNEANIEEVDEKIKEMAEMYGQKEEQLKQNEGFVQYIKESLKSEKAVEFIVENAKIK